MTFCPDCKRITRRQRDWGYSRDRAAYAVFNGDRFRIARHHRDCPVWRSLEDYVVSRFRALVGPQNASSGGATGPSPVRPANDAQASSSAPDEATPSGRGERGAVDDSV